MYPNLISIQYCYEYLLNQIPMELLLYSHVPTALLALMFGLFVLFHEQKPATISLFLLCFFFALWSLFDLGSWFAFLGAGEMMFSWALLDLFSLTFFFFSYYFLYTFLTEKDLPVAQKIFGISLLLPTAFWTLMGSTLTTYDSTICEAWENSYQVVYPLFAKGIYFTAIIILGVALYRRTTDLLTKKKIIYATTGILAFLGFFLSSSIGVSYIINETSLEFAYNYSIYGLFGMPILIVYLSYLIVKYRAFDLKILGTQALIVGLIVIIASEYIFVSSMIGRILISVTLLMTILSGFVIIKSVKREAKQKDDLLKLTKQLENTNARLRELDKLKSEFVSIASHQLRSPITAIAGYASLMREGSYGEVPPKIADPLLRIEESARVMATSIEDYLNVSRIEAGNMKYDFSDFNVTSVVEHICDDLRPEAMKRGLVLIFRQHMDGKGIIHADFGKTNQIIHNLINNAIKYTPKGTISVYVHDDEPNNTVKIDIADTGMGMNPETVATIFQKFERGKGASRINLNGTGLGLFIARKIAEAMGATITASSDGEGKGSRFTVTFKLLP